MLRSDGRVLRGCLPFVLLIFVLAFLPSPSAEAGSASAFAPGRLLVGFARGVSNEQAASIIHSVGATDLRTIGVGTHVLSVPPQAEEQLAAALQHTPGVRYAELDYIVQADQTPNDPSYGSQWGASAISAPGAWSQTTGSASIVVGVPDTGIDLSHQDLAANLWTNDGSVLGCPAGTHGYNVLANSCDPSDDNGHGSAVSGVIGAVGNNGVGVAGVTWSVSLMALKFLDANLSGTVDAGISAIDWGVSAKQAGVNLRVINASWGCASCFSQALLDEINKAGANDILLVANAGNQSVNLDTNPRYPCSYDAANEICDAATDQNDQLASFSNYGSAVKLAAPGVDILSTYMGGGYQTLSGTSMATPHVSGAAALVLSLGYQSVGDLRSTLIAAVDPVPSLAGLVTSGGRLDVCKAIPPCVAGPPGAAVLSGSAGSGSALLSWTVPAPGSSSISSYRIYRSTASGGESLLATMPPSSTSYTDAGLTPGVRYYYQVTAGSWVGEGTRSNEVSVAPTSATPLCPQSVGATSAKGKGVLVSWKAPVPNGGSSLTSYRIYRGTVATNPATCSTTAPSKTQIASVTASTLSFKDTNVVRGRVYYYVVSAVNAIGEGTKSLEARATAS
jgi:subtilisin family serine protease